jgi:hypothetical protein
LQQSLDIVQTPPSCTHVEPDEKHLPSWQTPPLQQSEFVVQPVVLIGTHVAAHLKPVDDDGSGRHRLLQQLSHKLHSWPAAKHAPMFGTHRETPSPVLMQLDLPPLQQFCDAPRPPQTSPSGWQLNPPRVQRRTPSASTTPHDPEQHCLSDVQRSL